MLMKHIQFVFVFMCIAVSISSSTSPKMDVTMKNNQMTLTCSISNRNPHSNIYLHCPFQTICKENCKRSCVESKSARLCLPDEMIQCNDRGIDLSTGLYIIEYLIDSNNPINNGYWNCSHASKPSSSIRVTAHPSISITTKQPSLVTMTRSTKLVISKAPAKSTLSDSNNALDNEGILPMEYSKLLTKSEFILSVIGLLAVSLIFNIFFCSRILFVKCKLKKPGYGNGDYFSMQQNQRPFNRCNSQVSDPERIYEDTSTPLRNMSLMTKIKQSNGNYVGQSTLSPSSGPPTLLPPNYLPLNHSLSFPGSPSDVISTPTQIYYPLPTDPTQTNYGALGFHPENQYTNFLSVQPEMANRDPNNQPLYLAFTPGHQFISPNSRYLQYSNQPLQMSMESTNSGNNTSKPSPVPSQVKNGLVQHTNGDQDNYQLSREMMEEADNLLRTADTLLKSTQKDMEMIK